MSTFNVDKKQSQTDKPNVRYFNPIRLRTYIIGVIAVIVICLIVSYAELVASRGGTIDAILLGATQLPPGAIGVLFLILAGNGILRKVAKPLRLNSGEVGVIYFMLVCAALLSSFGLVAQLLPTLAGINYFANPVDHEWRNTFFPHIAKWLVPWDPAGPERQPIIVSYYEGLKAGEHIPWGAWIVPVIAWVVFAFLLFFIMACVTTLFRKQWVDNEKLTFPLVQLPMEMIKEETSHSFFTNKIMWLGFAVPTIIHCINGLARSYPSIPQIPVSFVPNSLFTSRPWSEMTYTPMNLSFSIIGLSYLLPLDVSFSFWFFLLFFRFQDLIRICLNHRLDGMPLYVESKYQGYQSIGAFIAIAIMMFWLAKPHFKLVKERIFGNGARDIDKDEFMSYRFAFWGGLIAFMLMLVWLKAAGLNPGIAFVIMAAFVLVVMLVMTRCVAEVGLMMISSAFMPIDMMAVFVSKAWLGVKNLTVLSMVDGTFMCDPRNVMPAFMDGMKGSDYVNVRKRSMAIGTILTVGIGVLCAIFIQLWLTYKHGGLYMNSWFFRANPVIYISEAKSILGGSEPFDIQMSLWAVGGALFTFFLYAMRARFWWFPFHPLGYAMGCAWPTMVYWASFFIGWLVKSQIQHYGGAKIYRALRPFFLGLILGEFSMCILWAILRFCFGLATPAIPIG